MFRGISKLPPAHCLSFSVREGLKIRRYWDLSYEPKLKGSEDELLEALEQQLIESVRLHMVSDVPVGAFLSGGLDSTLVVAMTMKHAAKEPLPTFTIGLPYGEYDEAPAARLVAERYGTRHHEQRMVPSLVEHLPELVYFLDEPSDPLSVCSWLVSRMARREVKVVLGGDGGDELFGGYDRYYGNLYAGYYAMLPPAVRRGVISPILSLIPDGDWYKSKGHQAKWLHRASFLSGGERYARTLGYFYFPPEQQAGLFGPELRSNAGSFDPYAAIRDAYEDAPADHPVDRMLYADSRIRLPDHPVMIQDRMSMAHGLEARSPFMDHKVAEFCACTADRHEGALADAALRRAALMRALSAQGGAGAEEAGLLLGPALSAPRRVPPALRVLPLTVGAGPRRLSGAGRHRPAAPAAWEGCRPRQPPLAAAQCGSVVPDAHSRS